MQRSDFIPKDTDFILSELTTDLLLENIDEQLSNKSISINYLETIKDKINLALEEVDEEDGEKITELRELSDTIAVKIIDMIERECDIEIDVGNIKLEDDETLIDIASVLYEFFIISYKENIQNFYINYIEENKSRLSQELNNIDKKKKNKILDSEDIVDLIKLIRDMDIEADEFLHHCSEEDEYNSEVLQRLLDDGNITQDFSSYFFEYLQDNLDEMVFYISAQMANKRKVGLN